MIGRLNHVAIAVPDLAAATALYRDGLGATVSEPQALPEHGVTVVFVELPNTKVELLEPLGEESPIGKFLESNASGGMHHICYEVDNIDDALAHAQAQGASLRECKACQKTGSHAHPEGWVAFLDNDAGGIEIEFMQVYTPEQLKRWEDSAAEAV